MKCENCGKNEVTFVYQSNINGKVTEKHLCSECAEKLGYTQQIAAHSRSMMQNFFGGSLLGNGFFDDFFSPMPSLMGRSGWMLEDPFDDFFADMPALSAAPAQQQVLGAHVSVAQLPCRLLGKPQSFLGSGRKFVFIHRCCLPFGNI